MRHKLRLGIGISGGGTTMLEVLKACHDGRLKRIEPVLIISSRDDNAGILRARNFGIARDDIQYIAPRTKSPQQFGLEILGECRRRHVDLFIGCGFIPKVPHEVIEHFGVDIWNQHPGALDTPGRRGFGGKGMMGRAVHHATLYFSRHIDRPFSTCATVHRMTDQVDEGLLLGVQPVEILPHDDVDTLAGRVLPHEHSLVIRTLYLRSEFGPIPEIRRTDPLIHPDEIPILDAAISEATQLYPKG